ncbi:MAG TPA: hypothetical protein VG347_01245 [Verrucomicrobiae bacterium]|nr:hypothetical protein [Verrucomicrobiae bacterium]
MMFHTIKRVFLISLLFCLHAAGQAALPALRMTSSNGVSTVHWPLAGYSAILQTATSLSAYATWNNLVTGDPASALLAFAEPGGSAAITTNVAGNELTFNLAATNRQQFFRLTTPHLINACSYAIFYNGLLEFSQSATMIVNGRVHAEGPIYVGTTASLILNAPVTTTSTLSAPLVDVTNGWTPGNSNTWNVTFNGSPGCITNAISLLNYTNNFHYLIDPPADDPNDPNHQLLPAHIYDIAELVLLVTNDPTGDGNPAVRLILQNGVSNGVPGFDPAKLILTFTNQFAAALKTNLPFLSLTNSFYDQREYKTNVVTQIDVGAFTAWVATNALVQTKLPTVSGEYPATLYIADRRNVNARQLAVVRLINGAQLPYNGGIGFTIATVNPLYVWGNYNTQGQGNAPDAYANTTNAAFVPPAALISDALTLLSPAWADAKSFLTYNNTVSTFDASSMTVNAAIFAGTVASTGTDAGNFSGGVHNFPRLLEDWSGQNLWLNTSLVRLWDSQRATNQFRNPQGFSPPPVNPYYNPPTRHFNFDVKYLDAAKIPPGVFILDN